MHKQWVIRKSMIPHDFLQYGMQCSYLIGLNQVYFFYSRRVIFYSGDLNNSRQNNKQIQVVSPKRNDKF